WNGIRIPLRPVGSVPFPCVIQTSTWAVVPAKEDDAGPDGVEGNRSAKAFGRRCGRKALGPVRAVVGPGGCQRAELRWRPEQDDLATGRVVRHRRKRCGWWRYNQRALRPTGAVPLPGVGCVGPKAQVAAEQD